MYMYDKCIYIYICIYICIYMRINQVRYMIHHGVISMQTNSHSGQGYDYQDPARQGQEGTP